MEETTSASFELGKMVGGVLGCVFMIAVPALFIVSLILAITKKSKPWTIVAIITGLIGIALIGVIAFAAVKGVKQAAKAATSTKSVSGPAGRFTVDVPGNWSQQNLGSIDASLQVGNLLREEYLIVIEDTKADFAETMDIDGFAELAASLVVDNLENVERSEITPLEINGLPARRCRIEGNAEGIRIVYLNTYLEGADQFYQLMTWTLPSKKEAAFPAFEKAAATFREGIGPDAP